jgi:hypothetical protein
VSWIPNMEFLGKKFQKFQKIPKIPKNSKNSKNSISIPWKSLDEYRIKYGISDI